MSVGDYRDPNWALKAQKSHTAREDALQQAVADVHASEKPNTLFIIGGGEIFSQTMPLADRLELTHIELDVREMHIILPFLPSLKSDLRTACR